MEKWDSCAFPVNEDDLEGRVCYGGLDLSSTTDITAFVLVFPPTDEDDRYILLPYFWVPEETLDLRVRRDHVPYDLWERQGKGICKKVFILMLVSVAHIIDLHVVGTGSALRGAVICFYMSNEGLSLLENAAHIGLPIPDKLRDILSQLHDKERDTTDHGDGE